MGDGGSAMALRDGDDGGDERPTLEWRSRGSRSEHLPPTHLYYCGKLTIRGDSTTGCRRSVAGGVHRFRQRSRGATQWQQSPSARPKPTTGSRPRSRPLFFPVLSNYPRQPSSHCYHRLRKVRRLLQRCVRRHLFYSRVTIRFACSHPTVRSPPTQMPRVGSPIPEFSLIRQLERSEDLR